PLWLPVDRRGRREDDVGNLVAPDSLQQVIAGHHIVLVVEGGVGHRLPHQAGTRQVDDRIPRAPGQRRLHLLGPAQIGLNELQPPHCQGMTFGEVVHHPDPIPPLVEQGRHVTPNVAGAASDQHPHQPSPLPVVGPDSGAGPVDSRTLSSVGSPSSTPSRPSPWSPRRISSMARRPSGSMGISTVVKAGTTKAASGISSKPTTEASSGTRRPASRRARSTPMAIRSLAATKAVSSGWRARSRDAASRPPAGLNPPSATHSGRTSSPWAAIARR